MSSEWNAKAPGANDYKYLKRYVALCQSLKKKISFFLLHAFPEDAEAAFRRRTESHCMETELICHTMTSLFPKGVFWPSH